MSGQGPRGRRVVLAHLTLLHVPPVQLVELAAAAGYDGVTLQIAPPARARAGQPTYPPGTGTPMRELLDRLDGHGLAVHDVQAVHVDERFDVTAYEPMFEAAALLGARYAMTVCNDEVRARLRDSLGALAGLGARYGLNVALEYMRYSSVRTLTQANALIDQAGADNVVIVVDALHHARAGGNPADLAALEPRRIPYLQLCDAPGAPESFEAADLRKEALTSRLLPGEGALPLVELIDAMPAGCPLSVEVPGAARPPGCDDARYAAAAFERTMALCALAAQTARTSPQ